MKSLPIVSAVAIAGPKKLKVQWRGGRTVVVDLADWLERPSPSMQSLTDPAVFARAAVGGYGSMVTWDGGEGDLAIDALHLEMLADQQANAGDVMPELHLES